MGARHLDLQLRLRRSHTITIRRILNIFFSSRRRHTRFDWTGVQTCALPILLVESGRVVNLTPAEYEWLRPLLDADGVAVKTSVLQSESDVVDAVGSESVSKRMNRLRDRLGAQDRKSVV